MRSVVVYESMYGNTRQVAEEIALGLQQYGEVVLTRVEDATPEKVGTPDLLVVGGPTHMHGMTRQRSRQMAAEAATKPESKVAMEADEAAPGVREWLKSMPTLSCEGAAFDTRINGPAPFTGHASSAIRRRLRGHGVRDAAEPMSFLVTNENLLIPGERERAREWGARIGQEVARHVKTRAHA